MKVEIFNKEGSSTGEKIELAKSVFEVENVNEHAIYLEVKQTQANQRQGTHKVKERGEVSGSNKKPYRQKGTGNARPGSKRSPLWRHGGIIFGPRPRNYSFSLNKKLKRLAKKGALTLKAREKRIFVLEDFSFDKPKTKDFSGVISNLKLDNQKVLMVTGGNNTNVYLSSRNIPSTKVVPANEISTFDILNADTVVLFKESIQLIENNLNKA